jgi:hypothetical protein
VRGKLCPVFLPGTVMVPIRAIEPEFDPGLAEGGRNRRRFRVLPNRKRSVAMELRAARVIRLAAVEIWQTLSVAPAIGAERVPQIEIRWRKLLATLRRPLLLSSLL